MPTGYPNKPGIFSSTIPKKEYRLKKRMSHERSTLSKIEKKKNRESERNKRKALKAQERGRKEHINKQRPEVQVRMKKSFEESKRLRKHKSIWKRILFWKKKRNQ